MLIDTGVRLGELMSLTTKSVDLGRQVLIVNGKTGERYCRIGNLTAKILWRYLTIYSRINGISDKLWISRHGIPLADGAINQILYDLGDKIGLKLNCHLLRHSFATLFLINNGSPFDCQYLLGHKTLEMTKRYYVQAIGFEQAYKAHMRASPIDNIKAK